MSIESVAIALHHSRARGTAKLVLIGIANHDGDGGAWPSLATLAKYAGVDPRNVRKALRDLEALGEIRTHLQAGGNGRTNPFERPNLYDFLLRCPETCDRGKGHKVVDPPDAGVPRGRTDASPGPRTAASPEPSYEPPVEPSDGPADSGPRSRRTNTRNTDAKRALTGDEMQADFVQLQALCSQNGTDDPVSVWWTLRHDHDAYMPSRFMAKLIDYGEWDGFVGSHGINEYDPAGNPL